MPSAVASCKPVIRPRSGPINGPELNLPPNLVIRRPDDVTLRIGEFLRRADLVALVPVGLLAFSVFADTLQGGQGHKAVGLKDKQRFLVTPLAVDHQVAVPQVVGGAE